MIAFNLRRLPQVPTAVFAVGEPGEKIAATRDGHVLPARSAEDAAKFAEFIERACDGDGELPEPECIQNARAAIALAKGGEA